MVTPSQCNTASMNSECTFDCILCPWKIFYVHHIAFTEVKYMYGSPIMGLYIRGQYFNVKLYRIIRDNSAIRCEHPLMGVFCTTLPSLKFMINNYYQKK